MHFSQQQLIKISEQASTIKERLGVEFLLDVTQENDAIVKSRVELWCQIAAQGNWEQFEKRLAWDGLDLSTVSRVLGYLRLSDDFHLPAWAETLNECLKATTLIETETLEKDTPGKNRFLVPQEPLPFEEVLLSFIDVARQKLRTQSGSRYHLLSEEAYASLERSLLIRLFSLCSPSLELEFSAFRAARQSTLVHLLRKSTDAPSRKQYQDFVNGLLTGGLLAFFQEYPVLARLVGTVTNFWVDATEEFLSRLESDWSDIQKTFQTETELRQVVAVQPALSDYHHNGRSVTAVTFASGLKLIYKPKNLDLEQAYFKLLEWFNQKNASLPFKLLKLINRSTYGWVEFVESSPYKDKEEGKRYYQRAGALLCLVYLLNGTDLHYENIIGCGEHPVLIDLETLMHPRVREFQNSEATTKGAESLANQQLWHSVINTGLLPWWQFGAGSQAYDSSGLGGASLQQKFLSSTIWHDINTDKMILRYENARTQLLTNFLSLDSMGLSLNDYVEEIVDGFQQMYQFLLRCRQTLLASESPLTTLSDLKVRFVFRGTKAYSSILQKTLTPKFLRNGAERSIQLDILSGPMLLSDSKPLFWPLLNEEQQALEQMDIPLFTARSGSDALTVTPNQTIDKYFTEPSFNLVVSHLNQLNVQDFEQQIGFIRGALYARTAYETYPSSLSDTVDIAFNAVSSLTREQTVRQAIEIATNLQKQAICSNDGSATWIAPKYIPEAKLFQLQPIGDSLYNGGCGVALFLAALEKVTGGAGFRNLSLAALQSLRQNLHEFASAEVLKTVGIGGALGFGSIIYVLVRVSQFLDEPALLADAKQAASLITPDLIVADNKFDIISGAAGAILGLLTLRNISADSGFLEQAISCGHHLLNNRTPSSFGYRAWATVEEKVLTGFSHGAAGIAYALLRLYQASGEAAFLEAAQEAIAYERSVFIPEIGNWPDFTSPHTEKGFTCVCLWCNGAPGIGLARVAGLDILDTPEIRQDIEAAINTTKQYKLQVLDHLCCGNLGRVEFLFTAARKLSQPQLLETAMQQAAQVVAHAKQQGHFGYGLCLTFHPGFFQGAAGIGYELLRLAYPDQLPSVLLWE
jgi:type 2 lantibiotic biosynthesis protein LanM